MGENFDHAIIPAQGTPNPYLHVLWGAISHDAYHVISIDHELPDITRCFPEALNNAGVSPPGTSVSKDTISRITDTVIKEMEDWRNRPLDSVYAAIFIDAVVVKVRDGQVANQPVYAAIGVTVDGRKDVLGLWVGTGGEGAKFWLSVLMDLKNRGITDVFFCVCDGLKGLPDSVTSVWPHTIVQTCIVHLIRNTFRLVPRQKWDEVKKYIKPIYTAPNPDAALTALADLDEKWGKQYRAMIRLWRNAWEEFTPFLSYDVEIRKVLCSTNALESLNARYRRAVRARGHFPNEQAALKCPSVTAGRTPKPTEPQRWKHRSCERPRSFNRLAGGRGAYVGDPDGHVYEFFTVPPS